MCTVLLPPGDNPIAVNKYNIASYLSLHLFTKRGKYEHFNWSRVCVSHITNFGPDDPLNATWYEPSAIGG